MGISLTPSDPACTAAKHLTGHAYARYGCRCPEAKQARKGQWHVDFSKSTSGTPRGKHARYTDVDPVLVERAIRGNLSVRAGATERRIVVQRLTKDGLSAAQIAKRLGISPRAVQGIRQKLRAAS